ncbi:MAG: hypothetical protein MUC65_09475 [Pontiellaceae bacterium]|jgi:hypothetical protein|nr:hypothetical protein [Pontiellaceae bacterium]
MERAGWSLYCEQEKHAEARTMHEVFPFLGNSLTLDAGATLVGYGRSGYGSYGCTMS